MAVGFGCGCCLDDVGGRLSENDERLGLETMRSCFVMLDDLRITVWLFSVRLLVGVGSQGCWWMLSCQYMPRSPTLEVIHIPLHPIAAYNQSLLHHWQSAGRIKLCDTTLHANRPNDVSFATMPPHHLHPLLSSINIKRFGYSFAIVTDFVGDMVDTA